MTSLKINIKDDSNLPFILELLGKFDFVEIEGKTRKKNVFSKGVKKALKEVESARLSGIKLTSWDEFKKTI